MRTLMKFVMPLALLAALSSSAAAQQSIEGDSQIQVGRGLICDTQGQAERYAVLFDGDAEKAIETVNDEANQENACGVASVAFMLASDETKTVRSGGRTFKILHILVMGVVTPGGLQRVSPLPQYTLVKVDEIEV